jgi:GTP-binding protein Era
LTSVTTSSADVVSTVCTSTSSVPALTAALTAAQTKPAQRSTATIVARVTFRSGFCCFVGRPNAGKSTLTNALVGAKIVITSDKPQTTRHAVRGVLNRPDAQLILVDTPGLHRPRTLLGERLNDVVRATLTDVDVVGFCVPADQRVGPGDRFIAAELAQVRAPVVAVVTKTDAVSKARVAEQLVAVSGLGEFADVVPVSAVKGAQVDVLADVLVTHLPDGPRLYPEDVTTDNDDDTRIAELIREASLDGVRDELPHSIAVTLDEIRRRDSGLLEVFATIHLERDSQKGIMIGSGGARLKRIGTVARGGIEALLGERVHLALHVAVERDWQRDPKKLDRLGF